MPISHLIKFRAASFSTFRGACFFVELSLSVLILALTGIHEAHAVTDTFNASGTWTAPAGVTSATVEAWGGGGAGGGATGNPAKGGGGAGGQYSLRVVTVTPGNNYAVVVGAGGTGGTGNGPAGGSSTFATNVVVAQGGAGGGGAATNGGDGTAGVGSTAGGVGDTVFAGGSGTAGSASTQCNNGGGGGGGAGSTGDGGAASGNTGGSGTATGGGAGGTATNGSGNGADGAALGGGGAGACAESNTNRNGGDGGAGRVTITYTPVPVVVSINRAGTNPSYADDTVSWTVVFNMAVTGVDAADFSLVMGGGLSGASISSVTGSGTTWTVSASPGGTSSGTLGLNLVDNDSIVSGGIALGGSGAGNGNFTGQVYTISPPFCTAPSNIPGGVTVSCVCDRFGRASLNPSTIYGGSWVVSESDGTGVVPSIVNPGYLQITDNGGYRAKAATVPGIFPAAGNYISVEFLHYAYGATSNPGADGIAVTLSDSSVPAVPGGFGGSLGYAQRNDGAMPPGFNGGWVGIALDEWGNYQNPTEGRVNGPGFIAQSIGVRGPGSGANGYRWMGGTAANPGGLSIDNRVSATPAPGYMYQVIVDARSSGSGTINVQVNRDSTTRDGTTYATLFGPFNAYTEANFALSQGWISQIVPNYWKISFTGSTGGANNYHEIGGLRVCAQTSLPTTGGTASGFSVIDSAYPGAPTVPAYQNFQTGNIYMKLTGVPFSLWVAALTSTNISTGYSATSAKYVQVKLVDNTDNGCGPDTARTCNSTCTNKTAVETGATQIATFPNGGTTGVASPSPSFTLNSAWRNLVAIMRECTTSACSAFTATAAACSADSFSVRPLSITSVTSSNATNTGTSGTPIFKAGIDNFSLTATTQGVGANQSRYTGTLKINNNAIQALSPATVTGAGVSPTTFPAATSGTPSSTATGSTFTYAEVGAFRFRGYATTDATSERGIYDGVVASECTSLTTAQCDTLRGATWTGTDSISTKGDCVANGFSNTLNSSGKYGCNFGITADTSGLGRFIPSHFAIDTVTNPATLANRALLLPCSSSFTYMNEPMRLSFRLIAQNGANATTQNYTGTLAKLDPSSPSAFNFGARSGTTDLTSRITATYAGTTPAWSNGVLDIPIANPIRISINRAASPDGPYAGLQFGIAPDDGADDVRMQSYNQDVDNNATNDHTALAGTTEVRYGRLMIESAFGSELVNLPVPFRAQYWSGSTDGFVTNTVDNCTTVTMSAFTNPQGNLAVAETCVQDTGNPGLSGPAVACSIAGPVTERFREGGSLGGDFNLFLRAPGSGNDGSVDVSLDLSPTGNNLPWLRYNWTGSGDSDPIARATFGIFRGSPRHIYLRERY